MFDRIKQLRKHENLTQEEFAKKINISRANLGSLEIGRTGITDRVIADICREFNVSEEWLRTGKGEMFEELTPDNSIVDMAAAAVKKDEPSFQKDFLYALSQLTVDQWTALEDIMDTMIESIQHSKSKDSQDDEA